MLRCTAFSGAGRRSRKLMCKLRSSKTARLA